jgi:hypothetical protein
MLDTIVHRAGDQHHHHSSRTEVHEHRAPTDASVKLLREMEAAALAKILGNVRLEGCPVDCSVTYMRDPQNDEHRFFLRYKLGAATREVRHIYRQRMHLSDADAREDAALQLRDELAKDIANGLLDGPMRTMMGGKFPLFP